MKTGVAIFVLLACMATITVFLIDVDTPKRLKPPSLFRTPVETNPFQPEYEFFVVERPRSASQHRHSGSQGR
jgi:hypothetical protein